MKTNISEIIKEKSMSWKAFKDIQVEAIPKGDMPGDKIQIDETHIEKTNIIFPKVLELLEESFKNNNKIVVSVHGGSGVGKSETGSLLAYYLNEMGIGSYIMSGDNYPRRVPKNNDIERMTRYRDAGIKGLVKAGMFNDDIKDVLRSLWKKEEDADTKHIEKYSWLSIYQKSANEGLKAYLGTSHEINFDEVNDIIESFKSSDKQIFLKRMGRHEDDYWYDLIDFENIHVLIIEWTHGNNIRLEGVDVPILLNSTPEETLTHRLKRNRDGKTDSAFTKIVLEIEQALLVSQASSAKIIVSKKGEILDYKTYLTCMSKD